MARKTIADLEKELLAEKEKSKGLQAELDTAPPLESKDIMTGDQVDLLEENAQLKLQIANNKSHSTESESRLMDILQGMEDAGGNTDGCLTMTPDEYKAYSASKGRIMGRLPNQKTKCSIEELRALINSDWTPSMVMEKHGMSENDLQQLIWKLSSQELRDRPIKLEIGRDFFGKEG